MNKTFFIKLLLELIKIVEITIIYKSSYRTPNTVISRPIDCLNQLNLKQNILSWRIVFENKKVKNCLKSQMLKIDTIERICFLAL